MRTLVLWDIDGTLMRGTTVAPPSRFLQALREVYDLRDPIQRVDYGGKTDGQIVLETLALHAIDADVALHHLPRFYARYHDLIEEIADELHANMRLMPNVVPVLYALRERGAIQTLLTGNIAPVAALKLRAFDLDPFFDLAIGAYGSDDRDRDKLVPIAWRKANANYLDQIGEAVVIGDTPRDIACGKVGGARTMAVATGHYTVDQLATHNPDVVLADLSETAAVVDLILDPLRNAKER